jgi:hypothetical protein
MSKKTINTEFGELIIGKLNDAALALSEDKSFVFQFQVESKIYQIKLTEIANNAVPFSETVGGRVEKAEQMMQAGEITTPDQYFEVINTGSLETSNETAPQ